MRIITFIIFTIAGILSSVPAMSCTSVIISGKVTKSGKPVMYKNRDTGDLNNRISWFKGPVYNFIGLENSTDKGKDVWTGTNSSGFSIMNTASYNIKDDNVPASKMDKEGVLMCKALGVCSNLAEFEAFLDDYPRPMGVEANFGVIDAQGGAAYYEVNNYKWVKYDVNDPQVAPRGYRVVTNFSESGRREDYKGYERYLTASAIMEDIWKGSYKGIVDADHSLFFNFMSRSYRHEVLGIDLVEDYDKLVKKGLLKGSFVDQDFIPRRITSAAVAVEGVRPGEDPKHTVMWTILGYPAVSVAVPLLVADQDRLPDYVKAGAGTSHSEICDLAMKVKKAQVFKDEKSNGKYYFRVDNLVKGTEGKPALIQRFQYAENEFNTRFTPHFEQWVKGHISDAEFYSEYADDVDYLWTLYQSFTMCYLQ